MSGSCINTSKLVPGSTGIWVTDDGLINLHDIARTMAGSYAAKAIERLPPRLKSLAVEKDILGVPALVVTLDQAKEIIGSITTRRNSEFRHTLQDIITQHINPEQDWKSIARTKEEQLHKAHDMLLRLAECVISLKQKNEKKQPKKPFKYQRHPPMADLED